MPRALLALAFIACAGRMPASLPAPTSTRETVAKIALDYWELVLAADPRAATAMGDRRFDDKLEDLSQPARLAHAAALRTIVDRLTAFDPAQLSDAERTNRDALAAQIVDALRTDAACRYDLWRVDHLDGLQSNLVELAHDHGAATVERATTLIARYQAVPRLIDQHIANLNDGLLRGYVAPTLLVRKVIAQIDQTIQLDPSPFLPRFDADFAKDGAADEREKLFEELVRAVRAFVDTSLVRYREFLLRAVLPAARARPGVAALDFGAGCYLAEIARHTGAERAPHEIHRLGLDEVGRIRGEMQVLGAKILGTKKASPAEVSTKLAKDPAQHVKTRAELEDYARAIVARATEALPRAFSELPKAKVEVKAMDAFKERSAPAAYYQPAPEDGSRPAYYDLNTYAPSERLLYDQEALAFHEAVPGHHIQIGIAQTLRSLPAFRRHGGQTAFIEGWALYAERLAKELSLYSSDASEYGRLGYELWRAQRLVVDTGLHALAWTREQAIAFMKDGSTMPAMEIDNEVDRYIAWPAQALAYKMGELEIRRLRKKAEEALGDGFDLRGFHQALLSAGALPFPLVERRIAAWIEARKAAILTRK
jgi:uncharacterized protein (DUF885 family)